ncbi:MAG: hypothetical protein MUC37_11970 [Hyphomicrobium sp.]|nr:hypothetical protein [Hyphomicrobium sp.]
MTGEADATAKASRKLPDAARTVLRQVATDLRKAAGITGDKPGNSPVAPTPAGKPGDRAALPGAVPGRTAGAATRNDTGVME